MPLSLQLDQLCQIVRDVANKETMPRFLRVGSGRKEDGSLFTEADIETQRALEAALPGIFAAPVLGEEMSAQQQEALWQGHDYLWVIDPIDGTTNFVHGLPYFALSVALLKQGRPLLGVVYNPITNELFRAQRGRGADLNGQALPLQHHVPRMADAIAGVEVKWLSGHLPTRLSTVAPYGSQRNFGASTLDWCYLAAGRLDVYLHGGQKLWDYAAGCLILEEAGGLMTSIHNENFWEDDVWSRSVVAARDPGLFAEWRNWVRLHTR